MIAEVIVSSNANELNRMFDYGIPDGMEVSIGMRVLVPFARRKKYEIGYIVGIKEKSEFKCKNIIRIVDTVFDEKRFLLAKFVSERYFCTLSDAIRLLVPPGTSSNVDNVKAKSERWIRLTNDNVDFAKIKSDKQLRVIDFLIENKEAPILEVLQFVDVTRDVFTALEKKGIIEFFNVEVKRNPFWGKHIEKSEKLKLTDEQNNVVQNIDIERFDKYLIHGITGSGKTEVYLQLIEKIINSGKTALMLVPEISLTPQITDRFISRFGNVVAILHSRLSIGERYDEWRRIKEGKAKIVIGARSAIFAPLDNLGIVMIDEEHDASYKSEMNPKYDTKEVGEFLARLYDIPLVFGSATPDIRTYYSAQNGDIKLLSLKNRISKQGLPDISIVDMREELATGNRTIFSRALYNEMNKNIAVKEQSILFLNRRGYSTFIMCRDCGYVVKCEKCDISMTYHLAEGRLICHYCGRTFEPPTICPECNSKSIRYFGSGTQRVEQEINKYFPKASVLRMDVDTTRTKNAHQKILSSFKDNGVDILLGTQMITKGHDFENVTLVGVLAADSSMNISDYRASERTFQLLTQAIGRAGRGSKKGRAIIQTYMPEEFCILAAKEQDYNKFYDMEINLREKLNCPPFCDIIVAVLSGENEEEVKQEAKLLYELLSKYFKAFPPMPAPISKINGSFRWRIIAKEKLTEDKRSFIKECLNEYFEKRNTKLKLNFDINPNNMS